MMANIDDLLLRVQERIGGQGTGSHDPQLAIFPVGVLGHCGAVVQIRWRRSYDGVLSDERRVEEAGLVAALEAVLRWEDEADREDKR